MSEEYHVCDVCGKKIESEPPIVLKVGEDIKEFDTLNCFFRYLHKTFDVLIVRDFSLIHKP